jgi:hypothetical protein
MINELSFLDLTPRRNSRKWTPAKVAFIGGEGYTLALVDVEVRIEFVAGGFETKFSKPFAVPSEILLGSKFRRTEAGRKHGTKVFDIELRLPGFTMSIARMHPNSFPRTYQPGDIVGLSV